MSTTPIDLVPVGKLPPRDSGIASRAPPAMAEVFPGVYLIATMVRAKNQCVLELVQPSFSPASVSTSSLFASAVTASCAMSSSTALSSPTTSEDQRRLSEMDGGSGRWHRSAAGTSTTTTTAAAVMPPALKAGFRVPRIIQLVVEDEGVIETVCLVREPLCLSCVAAAEEQERAASQNPLRDRNATSPLSMSRVHVHFFIGTSNGTILVGNALRGTIVAVAQFQYHHVFGSDPREERATTTSTSVNNGGRNDNKDDKSDSTATSEADVSPSEKTHVTNQAVVKFLVRERREEQLWNPSLPFSQEVNWARGKDATTTSHTKGSSASASAVAAAAPPSSPASGSRVFSVYVLHSGGKVVELPRAALDVFIRCSLDRLDGHRPHLVLEWEPESSPSAFPVAGPASDFAAHVSGVFVLEPASTHSTLEQRAATARSASVESTQFTIRDADILTEMPERDAAESTSAVLAPLDPQRRPVECLLVGGSSPLFSFYRLHPRHASFSAAKAVRAVKNMVTGVARSLWFTALGTTSPSVRPRRLKKIAAPNAHPFLQPDAKCTAVQIDPTQQWAAIAIEGGGRVYVAEVQTGVVCAVLKGCRAAQFTWWWTDLAAGRPALLLLVYLPLRRAVEVYTPRTWERLAACHVPEGSVLLRPCGVPTHRRGSEGLQVHGVAPLSKTLSSTAAISAGGSWCGGCGSSGLLLDPEGVVYEVRLRWTVEAAASGTAQLIEATAEAGNTPGQSLTERAILSAQTLRGCQSPDDFLALALQLPLPCPRLSNIQGESPDGAAHYQDLAASVVTGGDEVRRYVTGVRQLCGTLQRLFAPGLADIIVSPIPCRPEEVLNGSSTGVPRNTTAAQALHFLQLRLSLVEGYFRLLSCRLVDASRFFDPEQWTSDLITAELWKVNFSTAVGGSAATTFAQEVTARLSVALVGYPAELTVLKKAFTPQLLQNLRKIPTRSKDRSTSFPLDGRVPLAGPGSLMHLDAFLRCFYCGTARPSFFRGAVMAAEDADGSVNVFGPLSDLIFGIHGVDVFFSQLPALADVGFSDGDLALLTVTWVARQGGRNLMDFFGRSTVAPLAATLLTFSDAQFLDALDRVAMPFISVEGDLTSVSSADSIVALLWCCAIRNALRPVADLRITERFVRRVRQLLQLWSALSSATVRTSANSADPTVARNDAAVAVWLRLGCVEPPSIPDSPGTASSGGNCGSREPSVGRSTRAGPSSSASSSIEGDTMEVYLQRNGISLSLLNGFVVPRADAEPDAVRNLPVFSAFFSSLGATEHGRSRCGDGACDSPDVVHSLPWIEEQQWEEERFRGEVVRPLEKLWQQLCSSSTVSPASALNAAKRGSAPASCGGSKMSWRGGGGGDGLDGKQGRSTVYGSCLILVAMSVLEQALRPLTDVTFFFWVSNTIPDGNFFPVDGAPAGLLLSGSRNVCDYLKSLQKLASLVETMVLKTVAALDNVDRVLLIQRINIAIAEDDAVLFPLIPNFLRARLTIWMQVLAQAPNAPLRRVQRVSRLVSLLLFFIETSTMTVGAVPLTQLQSHITVRWTTLIGGPDRRDQLRLLPDFFLFESAEFTQLPSTTKGGVHRVGLTLSSYALEDEDPIAAPLHVGESAAIVRRFLNAGATLYGAQYSQNFLTPAVPPPPFTGLLVADTRQCLTRLSNCLGLLEVLPDMAEVVLLDYAVKHLFPHAIVEQEMLLLTTRAAAPQTAASDLQCFLMYLLQYVTTQRKELTKRGERLAVEAKSEQLQRMVQALSNDARAWIQRRETEASANESEAKSRAVGSPSSYGVPVNPIVGTAAMLCAADWVSASEYKDMRSLVFYTLGLPKASTDYKNFFQLLSLLAQWVCQGRLHLPLSTQRTALELPVIVEKWEKLM